MIQTAEDGWMRCRYSSFWDVPRAFVFVYQNKGFELESPFEDEIDEYRPDYYVWDLGNIPPELIETLTWAELEARRVRQLDDVPVSAFKFHRVRERLDGRSFARVRFAGAVPAFMQTT
jgi:hypothetical protein